MKIGLSINLTKFAPPCSHFGITIFEQEGGKRGIPLYHTWHIVNSIILYHITSHNILLYHLVLHYYIHRHSRSRLLTHRIRGVWRVYNVKIQECKSNTTF